jgi:hypothetical protein
MDDANHFCGGEGARSPVILRRQSAPGATPSGEANARRANEQAEETAENVR